MAVGDGGNLRPGGLTGRDVHGPANAVNSHGWIVADGKVYRDDAAVRLAPVGKTAGQPWAVSDTGLVVGALLIDTHDEKPPSAGPLAWQCR